MRIFSFFSFLLLAIPLTAMANTECPIQFAHYKYGWNGGKADFSMTKSVDGQKSKLSLHLSFNRSDDLWFLFDQGNARYISLISTEDINSPTWTPPDPDGRKGRPIADQKFFAWNDGMKIENTAPVKNSIAPEYFLIPDLPETLQFDQRKPVIIGAGIYKFDFCQKQ